MNIEQEYRINTIKNVIDELPALILQHIEITVFSVLFAVIFGVFFGILAAHNEKVHKIIMPLVNVIQTIPSLALFGILVPISFFGVGIKTAIFALFLYAIMPIISNTYIGIKSVDESYYDAAKGMGLTNRQILTNIELKLAAPYIMNGIRIATIVNVATAAIASRVGAGGLGDLIFRGIDQSNIILTLSGALFAALLAIILDKLLALVEKSFDYKKNKSKFKMRYFHYFLLLIFIIPTVSLTYKTVFVDTDIVVWSKGYTEQSILSNMAGIYIEENTDYNIEVKELGSSQLIFSSLLDNNDEAQMSVDYTGTIYNSIYKLDGANKSEEVYEQVESAANSDGLEISPSIGFNNTYTITFDPEVAQEYNLEKISDIQKYPDTFTIAGTLESVERDDALKGAIEFYDLEFKEVKALDQGLRYNAIISGEVDAVDAFSTDPKIIQYDLKVLEDDQNFFFPYDGIFIFNEATIEKYPEVVESFNDIGGSISDEEMQDMNYQVDTLGRSSEEVAREFLVDNGYIN